MSARAAAAGFILVLAGRTWAQCTYAIQDPHLSFAHGGKADFRGRHGALYNFLSAPGLAVNVKTEEARFRLHNLHDSGGTLVVDGSFITEVTDGQDTMRGDRITPRAVSQRPTQPLRTHTPPLPRAKRSTTSPLRSGARRRTGWRSQAQVGQRLFLGEALGPSAPHSQPIQHRCTDRRHRWSAPAHGPENQTRTPTPRRRVS